MQTFRSIERTNLQLRLRALAYPSYDCKCCVGQDYWQGCYCWYHRAFHPSNPDGTARQQRARALYDAMYGAL